ncbi:MAG: hypothetical protein KKB13_18560, partial [Chloroflexi bacterium]|nr:hypothetical protein [Chloroflexota bacterium]
MTTTTDNSAALAALLGTHGVPETSIPALVADVLTQVAAIPPNPDWQTRRDLRAALRQTLVAHGVRCWDTAAFVEYYLLPDKPFTCERIHGHYMSTPLSIAEAEPTGFAGLDARFHSWASDGQIQVRVVVYPDNHPSVEQILTLPCHWVRPDIHQGNGTYELPPTEWVRECQVRYPGASCFFRVGDRLETWDPRVPSTTVRSIIQPGQTDPTVRQLIPAARWSEMDELALLARLAVQYAPVAICRHYGGREDAAMVVHPWAWDRPSESPRVGSDTAMLAGYLFERPTGQPVVRLVLTPDREHYQVFPDPDGEDLALVERLMPTQTIDRRPGCFYVGQRLLLLQAGYYLIIQRSPTQVQVITPESWELLRHTPYSA